MTERDRLLAAVAVELWEHGQRANRNTDEIRAILAPFLAAWDAAELYKIPGPYEIAMAFGAAAVAGGKAENIAAGMMQAWAAVPEFYKARDWYVQDFAPMRMGLNLPSPAEGTDHE